jgi:hypothetical protein
MSLKNPRSKSFSAGSLNTPPPPPSVLSLLSREPEQALVHILISDNLFGVSSDPFPSLERAVVILVDNSGLGTHFIVGSSHMCRTSEFLCRLNTVSFASPEFKPEKDIVAKLARSLSRLNLCEINS